MLSGLGHVARRLRQAARGLFLKLGHPLIHLQGALPPVPRSSPCHGPNLTGVNDGRLYARIFSARLAALRQELDVEDVKRPLRRLRVETPSWGYGDSGTRFKTFPLARRRARRAGEAGRRRHGPQPDRRLPVGRAAHPLGQGRRLGGAEGLRRIARAYSIGAINPNLFQDDDYKLGSVCNPEPRVSPARRRAHAGVRRDREGYRLDGSQPVVRRRHELRRPGLLRERKQPPPGVPASRSTPPCRPRCGCSSSTSSSSRRSTTPIVPDWGTAYALALKLGPQAQVLVDTGHHPQGTNVEQIVAFLLDEGKLGGFHFNARKYADDDLIVGSRQPLRALPHLQRA